MAVKSPDMKVRLPDEVRAILEASAKKNARSLNAEIVWALSTYYGKESSTELRLQALEEAVFARK